MIPIINNNKLWTGVGFTKNDENRYFLTKRLIKKKADPINLLIINTFSGAIDLFTKKEWKQIETATKNRNIKALPRNLYKSLVKRGYLFYSQSDEKSSFIELMDFYRKRPVELLNFIIPTGGCNFRCTYCFEMLSYRKNHQKLSDDQVETSIQIMKKRFQESNNRLIRFFGGEPLQLKNIRIIEKYFKFAREEKLTFAFNSNGYDLIDYIPLFKEYPDINLYLQVSLDGIASTHNVKRIYTGGKPSFDKIVSGIDEFVKLPQSNLTIRHNIDKDIINIYDEVISFIKEKKWHKNKKITFQLSALLESFDKNLKITNIPDIFEIIKLYNSKIVPDPELNNKKFYTNIVSSEASYLSTLFNFDMPGIITRKDLHGPMVIYCHSAMDSTKIVYHPDGYLYNCENLIGNKKYAIGKYSNNSFTLFEDEIEKWSKRTITNIKECLDCNLGPLCGGGCPTEIIWRDQDIFNPSCDKKLKIKLLDMYLDYFIQYKLPNLIKSKT
ncbi:MAG: radical SAM protein [Pseudomonadota bacterium]